MAHGITSKDMMAYAGKVPWHGLGVKFEGEGLMTAEKAIQLAQLGWTVKTLPLYVKIDDNDVETSAVAIVREDTNDVLGVATEDYTPIQNSQLFSFFDHLVEEGKGFVETAGSLFEGRKVWVLGKLEGLLEFKHGKEEEVFDRFIFLLSSHDRTASFHAMMTPVRVVCNNTVQAALGNCSNKVSIRHSPNAEGKIREARTLMNISTKYYEEFGKMAEFLAGKPMGMSKALMSYFEEVFPFPLKRNEDGKMVPNESNVVKELRAQAMVNFSQEEDRYGADWLSALNAATGVSTHAVRYRNDEFKLDSVLSGKAYDMGKRAVELAIKEAN